ncbi:MAG: 50S ribosomal protein L1 [Candidatus Kuenenbacteria bacterium]
MKRSKRYKSLAAKIDKNKTYTIDEAVKLVKETSQVKFDATVEAHIKLGIDTKKGEQSVRGSVILPYGSGKTKRVVVFSKDEKIAKNAGADIIGNEDLIKEIKASGKIDFDIAIAAPEMMKNLSGIAKILGPRGLMPSPKAGTVVADKEIAKAVEEVKKGKVSFKNDDGGNLHQAIGKASWENNKLKENFEKLIEAVEKSKPAGMKGEFVKGIHLTSSMGPAVKIER